MRLISTIWSGWYKKGLPLIWFGFLGLISLLLMLRVALGRAPAASLLLPVGMAAWGYAIMRWLRVFSFVDEVWLDGDDVVVRDRGQEDRFPVSQILSVGAPLWCNPERIVLTLSDSCRFGYEVVFSPPYRFCRFTRHPLAEELDRRAREVRDRGVVGSGPAEPATAPGAGT